MGRTPIDTGLPEYILDGRGHIVRALHTVRIWTAPGGDVWFQWWTSIDKGWGSLEVWPPGTTIIESAWTCTSPCIERDPTLTPEWSIGHAPRTSNYGHDEACEVCVLIEESCRFDFDAEDLADEFSQSVVRFAVAVQQGWVDEEFAVEWLSQYSESVRHLTAGGSSEGDTFEGDFDEGEEVW